ncbi:putative F-box protein [Arabidopsis thaliana]
MICFDFTRGGFGPLIPLPFKARGLVFAPLSSDRAEKIAALFRTSKKVVIWITTKIDATNVTWSNFFTIYISNLERNLSCKSFFIDMEKKVAMAGCVRKLVLKESGDKSCWPLVCSYVPSTVQIKQHNRGKRQKKVIRKGIDIDMRHDKRIKVD